MQKPVQPIYQQKPVVHSGWYWSRKNGRDYCARQTRGTTILQRRALQKVVSRSL